MEGLDFFVNFHVLLRALGGLLAADDGEGLEYLLGGVGVESSA